MNDAEFYYKAIGFVALVAAFVAGIWKLSRVYATEEWCREQNKEIREDMAALSARVDDIEEDMSNGRVEFGIIKSELSFIRENLSGMNRRLDTLIEGRIRDPQCTVASDAEKRGRRHA